ncbi:hypothetical protein SRABI83_04458 [Arthrobacter sp. Bi83]|nr:hypothetical protein SRABI83_04458 [Arthrobacter sp. Bi83]
MPPADWVMPGCEISGLSACSQSASSGPDGSRDSRETSAGASSFTRMAGLSSAANSSAATCLQSLRTGQLQTPTVQLQPAALRTSFAVVEYGTSAPPRTLPSISPVTASNEIPDTRLPMAYASPAARERSLIAGVWIASAALSSGLDGMVRATFSRSKICRLSDPS